MIEKQILHKHVNTLPKGPLRRLQYPQHCQVGVNRGRRQKFQAWHLAKSRTDYTPTRELLTGQENDRNQD